MYFYDDAKGFLNLLKRELRGSKRYCFATAYFDLKTFAQYYESLKYFIENNKGKAIFLISSQVDDKTYEAIRSGKNQDFLKFKTTLSDLKLEEKLIVDLYEWIKNGRLEIKIAVTNKGGIFHVKQGYILNKNNDWIAWSGSLNHTTTALLNNNVEQINTFTKKEDSQHGSLIIEQFNSTFNGKNDNIFILNAEDYFFEELLRFTKIHNVSKLKKLHIDMLLKKHEYVLFLDKDKYLRVKSNEKIFEYTDMPNKTSSKEISDAEYKFDNRAQVTGIQKWATDNKWFITKNAKLFLEKGIKSISDKLVFGHEIKKQKLSLLNMSNDSFLKDKFHKFIRTSGRSLVRRPQDWQLIQSFYAYKLKKSLNFSVPGTGKTMTALITFNALKNENKLNRLFVICPTSAMDPWKSEWFETFGYKAKILNLSQRGRTADQKYRDIHNINNELFDIVIMHFATAHKYQGELEKQLTEKDLLVIDEAHYIKNPNGTWGKEISKLINISNYSMVLTGTPAPNGTDDIKNIVSMTYGKEYYELKKDNIKEAISNLFIRVDYSDLKMKWKQKILFEYYDLNNEQKAHEKKLNSLQKTCPKKYGYLHFYINMLQLYSSSQAVTNNLADATEYFAFQNPEQEKEMESNNYGIESSPKLKKLLKIIKNSKEKRIVVWSVFLNSMNIISKELLKLGVINYVYNGSLSVEERLDVLCAYKNNGGVLIANAKTMAESVSLHKNTDLTIYFEFTLSLTELQQSMNRTYRYGNTKDSDYIFLISKNGEKFDSKIYNFLQTKIKHQKNLIDLNTISENITAKLKNEIKRFVEGF